MIHNDLITLMSASYPVIIHVPNKLKRKKKREGEIEERNYVRAVIEEVYVPGERKTSWVIAYDSERRRFQVAARSVVKIAGYSEGDDVEPVRRRRPKKQKMVQLDLIG